MCEALRSVVANLSISQEEQLKEIGAYLYQTRQNQGRCLEQIATAIYIRSTLLRAIEDGDSTPLPEPVFIQGFIRRYGDALGLDGVTLSRKFSIESPPILPMPEMPESIESAAPPAPKPAMVLDFARAALKNPLVQTMRESSSAYLSYLAIAIVAVIGISIIAGLMGRPKSVSGTADGEEPTAELTPSSTASSATDADDKAASPLTETAVSEPLSAAIANPPLSLLESPINVAINLTGDCWMRVTVDGQTQFEGMLSKGTQKNWTAQEEIRIKAGNAGAVLFSLNGASAQLAGDLGAVKDLIFTPTSTPDEIAL